MQELQLLDDLIDFPLGLKCWVSSRKPLDDLVQQVEVRLPGRRLEVPLDKFEVVVADLIRPVLPHDIESQMWNLI